MKWDSVCCLALCTTRAFPDGGRLGKTVQMIATMAMNMPGPDENNRTSLVVVPAALLYQVTPMLPDDTRLSAYPICAVEGRAGIKNEQHLQRTYTP